MKALVVQSPGRLELLEREEPTANDGEVVVAPLMAGMCGTDLELIDGSIDPAYVRYPLVLGHEWVGALESDLAGVASRGEHVVVEGVIACGVCDECRRGDTNRCVTYDEIGFTRPGAIAERIVVPANLVHRLAPSVELSDAVLIEPMAVVWRALTRLPLREAMRVAVVGDGTIALLAAHMVRLFAPSTVVVVGRRHAQAPLARRAGADEFTTLTPEGRFDLVIEAAGNGAASTTAIALADRGAMVIMLGLAPHGTVIELAPDDLVNNDQILQGSFSYTSQSWAQVVERVNAGELKPSFLITHRFGLDRSLEAVDALRGGTVGDEPRGKVVITL
jgi:threonine dehydrogenase-like Zn-dependent dehydrogenase